MQRLEIVVEESVGMRFWCKDWENWENCEVHLRGHEEFIAEISPSLAVMSGRNCSPSHAINSSLVFAKVRCFALFRADLKAF
jgi:hypothetical protein